MAIPTDLAKKFWKVIEISNVPWSVVDDVACSDPNILRPIKGVCFEEMFRIFVKKHMPKAKCELGLGDSDIDIYLNQNRLQLKTTDKGSTVDGRTIGVALHKTHGYERRPYNLYSINRPLFDFLVVLHLSDGILVVPYAEIPENSNWPGYLADPAKFEWNSEWKNRWELLGLPDYTEKFIDNLNIPSKSQLPKLSAETYLEDYQIIQALCRPEYFRAAVMGLKGNIKEYLLIDTMRKKGYPISTPTESYPKYDFVIKNSVRKEFRVQIKGTSKNMCDASKGLIGVEVMGTHGRFPSRGYKKSYFDYLAIVISEDQINKDVPTISRGLHFVFIPVSDLPLHYLIGKGIDTIETGWGNADWNLPEYNNVLYPNIKLKIRYNKISNRVEIIPDLSSYKKYKGFDVIPHDSNFRSAGPYILDEIPNEFE